MPSIDSGSTRVGVIIGVNPALVAWSIAEFRIAVPSCAPTPRRNRAGAGTFAPRGHVDRLQALGDLEVVLDLDVEARDLADGLADDEVLLKALGSALGEFGIAQGRIADSERLAGLGLSRSRRRRAA